jgi:hypothetical protein
MRGPWLVIAILMVSMATPICTDELQRVSGGDRPAPPHWLEGNSPAVPALAQDCEPASNQPAQALEPTSLPRVRPTDVAIAMLLLSGVGRSPTLREQVEALAAGNVVVYLELRPNLGHRIGSLRWVASGGDIRYLKATIDAAIPGHALLAAVGHELEHAREVADEPSVVDAKSFAARYSRIGFRLNIDGKEVWETQRAYDIGARIHRELAHARRNEAPIRLRQPLDWWAIYQCRRGDWQSGR